MLKVLNLFDEYLPPSQIWAYNLLSHLKEVEIHIAAKYYWKNNFYHPTFKFTEPLDPSFAKYTDSGNRSITKRLWLRLSKISLQRSYIHINYLADYIKCNKIDLIHAHFGPVGWDYLETSKRTGLPYLVSFYGYDYQKLPNVNPVYNGRYQKLFKHVELVLSEGPHAREQLINLGVPSAKAVVAPLGVNLNKIRFKRRVKQARSLRMIQVASFTEKKGHIYTIKAFAEALQACPNMQLELIGGDRDGHSLQKVKQLIEAKGLLDKVTVLDFVSFDDLSSHLDRCDVFIHPSCTAENGDTEGGAPVILLEAQASGLPIISTKHCDIPAVVLDGESGILVGERQTTELVDAIKYFYHLDQDHYQIMSRTARQFVTQHYDLEKNAEILYQYYRRVMKKNY